MKPTCQDTVHEGKLLYSYSTYTGRPMIVLQCLSDSIPDNEI